MTRPKQLTISSSNIFEDGPKDEGRKVSSKMCGRTMIDGSPVFWKHCCGLVYTGLVLVMYSCSKKYIGKVGVPEGIKGVEEEVSGQ
jgi:hypothetical protein